MPAVQRLVRLVPEDLKRAVRHLPFADRLRTLIGGRPRPSEMVPGRLRPVVYPPTWLRFEEMKQRPQFLLEAFAAAGHDVFFVDTSEHSLRMVGGVTIVPSLRDVPGTGPIVYSHFAPMRHVFDLFDDPVLVYDILDDLSIYDDEESGLPEARRVRSHHPVVAGRADVVTVSNRVLADRHRGERPDLLVVENGVDAEAFSAGVPRPADLPDGTVVGYHGMISTWFDFALVESVASRLSELRFVLVGPVDERVRSELDALCDRPNVMWLGERPSSAMPGYAAAFDVGVVWFVVDDMTSGVTPLKMYEYLAAGTPCVSTPLPAAVVAEGVRTASGPEAVVRQIGDAFGDDAGRLRALGRAADWTVRLAPVLQRLDDLGRRRY